VVEISQQVVSQIREQYEAFLGQESSLPPGREIETVFVIPELLHFRSTTVVVKVHETTF
jgi:hypothetical protein